MAQRIIQICDRCKTELDASDISRGQLQNYHYHHTVTISINNSCCPNRENRKFDLCPDCEELLFKFLEKIK